MLGLAAASMYWAKHPTEDLPPMVVFHALVEGFDVSTPITDPNAFSSYFVSPAMQGETRFVALHAPAIVLPGQMPVLRALPGIKEAYQRMHELDLIVTSAANMADDDSMLLKYYRDYSPHTVAMLCQDGCAGDMLWLPLASHGPIDSTRYPHRAITLIELAMLPGYIQRGTQVLLVFGSCSACHHPKTDILRTLLHLPEPILTHLIVDSRSARGLLEAPAREG